MSLPEVVLVQADLAVGKPAGFVDWREHLEACDWKRSRARRVAEQGGHTYGKLVALLGREPTTWVSSNLP